MSNIALNKRIIENWIHSEELTNGNIADYSGNHGFCWNYYPNVLTLDLNNIYEIDTIRFLLFDLDIRNYKYRLLTSMDLENWVVHYDTGENGFIGWQNFKFPTRIKVRYIRIHALWNSKNTGFHLVQLEAYDENPPELIAIKYNEHVILNHPINESGDGLSLAPKLNSLIIDLRELSQKYPGLDKDYFQNIINSLQLLTKDISSIESSLLSVKRQIIDPVNKELERSNRIGNWSVVLGIIGGIIGIVSIIISIFFFLNGIFSWIK